MHFSVYFDCILNEKNGSFHIEIMISAAHMMGACYATKFFEKMYNLMRLGEYFDQILHKFFFFKSSLCIEECSLIKRVTATSTEYHIC